MPYIYARLTWINVLLLHGAFDTPASLDAYIDLANAKRGGLRVSQEKRYMLLHSARGREKVPSSFSNRCPRNAIHSKDHPTFWSRCIFHKPTSPCIRTRTDPVVQVRQSVYVIHYCLLLCLSPLARRLGFAVHSTVNFRSSSSLIPRPSHRSTPASPRRMG